MGVLAPVSAHAGHSAQPPIDASGNFPARVSAESIFSKFPHFPVEIGLIGGVAMVDDLLAIRECGLDSTETNASINTLIELKKLQFHVPEPNKKSKCHYLHVGKANKHCPGMKVHGVKADRVEEAVYLGDIIRQDGRNTSNVKSRVNKGLGIVSKIMDILKTVSYGEKYFEIATTLREAELVNGILTNVEVWYGMSQSEIEELEDVDKHLQHQVLPV